MDNVRGRLVVAAKAGNLMISSFTSSLKSTPQRPNNTLQSSELAPTQEDINSANEMSGKDRENFIRSMVERLADRLKSEPNDLSGWRRLARAYKVLGDTKKAAMAEGRVRELEK